jgi:hypothetical protein
MPEPKQSEVLREEFNRWAEADAQSSQRSRGKEKRGAHAGVPVPQWSEGRVTLGLSPTVVV